MKKTIDELNAMSVKALVDYIRSLNGKANKNNKKADLVQLAFTLQEADSKEADKQEADSKEADKQEKKKRKTTKDFAENFLTENNVPTDSYTVDSHGRYNFKLFYFIFCRDSITLGPSKKFRENHLEIDWEFHKGWSNPYRTPVAEDFAKTAIKEALEYQREAKKQEAEKQSKKQKKQEAKKQEKKEA